MKQHDGVGDFSHDIAMIQNDISGLIDEHQQGAKIQSRIQFLEKAKKPSRYFLMVDQLNASRRRMDKMVDSFSKSYESQEYISAQCVKFYGFVC